MSQKLANYNTDCAECMTFIAQDEPVWFGADGEKLCEGCARKQDRVCPQCQGSKRAGYEVCFGCVKRDRENEVVASRAPGQAGRNFKGGRPR